jgi:glucan phosphoethanolaminetransferase (alkaline phosphatase superfamily)
MVFPTLQAIVGPIAVVYSIVQWFKGYGDQASYELLSSASRMFMLASLVLQGVLLMACLAQPVLLFRKRNSFPLAFVVIKTGFIVVAILSVCIIAFGRYDGSALARVIGTLAGTMIFAAIWVAYILKSQRVRATFVRDVRGEYPAMAPPGEPAPA